MSGPANCLTGQMLSFMCFRYIVGFYRAEQKSVWDSVRTVFSLHNETGNVWTHFLGMWPPGNFSA
jgi:predicted membrane channel-forming protein YqfA (hemolysin III family)